MVPSPLGRSLFLIHRPIAPFGQLRALEFRDTLSGDLLLSWREQDPSWQQALAQLLPLVGMSPFDFTLRGPDGATLAWARRGFDPRSRMRVEDAEGRALGLLREKSLSLRNGFRVEDADGKPVCDSAGRDSNPDGSPYIEWSLRAGQVELGWVGWRSLGGTRGEMRIADRVPADSPVRILILAAALAIHELFDTSD